MLGIVVIVFIIKNKRQELESSLLKFIFLCLLKSQAILYCPLDFKKMLRIQHINGGEYLGKCENKGYLTNNNTILEYKILTQVDS